MVKTHISKDEVEHVAWLAKIELSEDEKELFSQQFNAILDYFKIIDKAPIERVPATHHVIDLISVLREDVIEPSLPKHEALKNAPRKVEGYFKAPRIL